MNCEQYEDPLLSLAEGDLPPEEAADVRAHAASCARCGELLERLSAGHQLSLRLPMADPPAAVGSRIMAAARAHAAGHAGTPAAPHRGLSATAILQWLREVALGPQVAMATVMLLVVAIGVWYLPDLRREPDLRAGPVMHPPVDGEPAPSAEAMAAMQEPAEAEAPLAKAEADMPAPGPPAAPMEEKTWRKRRQRSGFEGGRGAGAGAQHDSKRKEVAAAPRPRKPLEDRDTMAEQAPAAPPARSATASRSASSSDSLPGLLGEDEAGTAPDPLRSHADALMALARTQKNAGDCKRAVETYEAFLGAHRQHRLAPRAMLEAADCWLKLGNVERARHWLTKAAGLAPTSREARAALQRLDAPPAAADEPAR
jgi:tetratricopeptide (TPR) repeat protein